MANKATVYLQFTPFDLTYSKKLYCMKIRQKFGMLGHAMIYEVLSWITEQKGCYAEWCGDVPELFATTRMFDVTIADKVAEVFGYMVQIGFFDPAAFEAGYLTSEGIVERWILAKVKGRNGVPVDDLPSPVRTVADRVIEKLKKEKKYKPAKNSGSEEIPDNCEEIPDNCANRPDNCEEIPDNCEKKPTKEKRRKEVQTNKQTNKARGEFLQQDSTAIPDLPGEPPAGVVETPPAPPDPEPVTDTKRFVAAARDNPRWAEIRGHIVRLVWSDGICSDLVDMFAAAGASGWITVPQVSQWVRAAKDERDQYRRSKGYAGKKKLWEVLRPLLADVYRAHGMELPPCDPRRLEPPPPPQSKVDAGLDDATRAGRAVMAPV